MSDEKRQQLSPWLRPMPRAPFSLPKALDANPSAVAGGSGASWSHEQKHLFSPINSPILLFHMDSSEILRGWVLWLPRVCPPHVRWVAPLYGLWLRHSSGPLFLCGFQVCIRLFNSQHCSQKKPLSLMEPSLSQGDQNPTIRPTL